MHKRFCRIFIFFLILSPYAIQSFASDQENKTLPTIKKTEIDTLKISFRLNTKKQDKKNYLKWKNSSKKISDSYDALSGASVSHSTGGLLSIFRDEKTKNYLAPKGLRHLLLFAVSKPEHLESDNFSAEKSDDGKIKISFTHRKNKYFIQTGEKGILNTENGFFISEILKNENQTQTGKEIPENLSADGFEFDKAASSKKFEGKLSVKLSGGILKISGKLNLVEFLEENPAGGKEGEI